MPSDYNISSYDAAIGGIATVLALDVIVVTVRLYAKKLLRQRLELNDWLILPALVNFSRENNRISGTNRD